MRVYDAFLFFNELELLRIRLEVLKDHVDHFVLTESTMTFSGKPKPLYYYENRHLFKDFESRIIHNVVEDTPQTNVTWDREIWQRNAIKRGLSSCKQYDIVFTGDLDEVPNLDHFSDWYRHDELFHPMLDMYYYYLNNFRESDWFGTKICSWDFMKDINVDALRNMKSVGYAVPKSGWHWSYLGNADHIRAKMDAFSDLDLNNPFIRANVENHINAGTDLFFRGQRMTPVPIDETFPQYVRDNQEKYKHLIRSV